MAGGMNASVEPWTGRLPTETWIDVSPEQGRALGQEIREGTLTGSPLVAAITTRVRQSLASGGVAIVRGLPTPRWTEEESAKVYLAFGCALGTLREQNASGDLLHAVTDKTALGVSTEKAGGSNSKKKIDLHTENARPPHPPHILSLLCLRPAKSGGASQLMDGYQVLREVSADDSMLASAQEDKAFGRHAEDCRHPGQVDHSPIFWNEHGRVNFRYSRYWLEVAATSTGGKLSESDEALYGRIDDIIGHRDNQAEVLLRSGEALFVDNRRVMHGRESFEDHPARRRRLLRMWIDTAGSDSPR